MRLSGREFVPMQCFQVGSGWLAIEPVVDGPRPLTNRGRILDGPAAWADVRDFTIEQRVVLLDSPRQRVFPEWDLAGAGKISLTRRQIEFMIVVVDLLEVIPGRLEFAPGWLPMTDRRLHQSIARRYLEACLRLRSIHNGH
jgi:hypothetical protein